MLQDVWIKFYGRGWKRPPQCYNKIKKPSAYRVKAQDLLAWNWLKTCDEPHTVRCDTIINK